MGSSLFPDYNLEKTPYMKLRYWQIYKAINKSTGESLSAFIFEKKNLEKKTEEEKKQLDSYMYVLPNKFYSRNYLEIMKYKNKICNNNYELLKNIENIDKLFSSLESYYEQLSVIENLFNDIEIQSKDNNKNNYISISHKDIKKNKKKNKSKKKMIVILMKKQI